jgi:hypothetical protein
LPFLLDGLKFSGFLRKLPEMRAGRAALTGPGTNDLPTADQVSTPGRIAFPDFEAR